MIKTEIQSKNTHGEYVVRLIVDGIHQKEADYHTDDRNDAALTAAAMREREEDTQPEAVEIKTSSSEVTGNGWLDGLAEGEKRIRWNAWIDGEYPNGIKGSPLGRGWSEEEARRDLVIRVMRENRIRLELYQKQLHVFRNDAEMLKREENTQPETIAEQFASSGEPLADNEG